jgi:hypothetical protein
MSDRCDLCQGDRFLRYGNGEDRPCPVCNEVEAAEYERAVNGLRAPRGEQT